MDGDELDVCEKGRRIVNWFVCDRWNKTKFDRNEFDEKGAKIFFKSIILRPGGLVWDSRTLKIV